METRAFHLPLQHLDLVPEHQEFDVLLSSCGQLPVPRRRRTRKYRSENNMESPSGRGERMLQVP
jgi:hypothetical protein